MTWNTAAQNHLAARLPVAPRWLLWVDAKQISNGAAVSMGLWTGDDHEQITVEGQSRLYYGAQGTVSLPQLRYAAGTDVGSIDVTLPVSPEAETLVRGYNIRFAPCDLHCALYDPASGSLLDVRRMFRGLIDGSPIFTPAVGGVATATLKLVSSARTGTMTTRAKKSDQSQRLRSGDRFRRYGDLGTVAADPWGSAA